MKYIKEFEVVRSDEKVVNIGIITQNLTRKGFLGLSSSILSAIRREGEFDNAEFIDFPKCFPQELPGKMICLEDFVYYRTYSGREFIFQWEIYGNGSSRGIITANFHSGSECLSGVVIDAIKEFDLK